MNGIKCGLKRLKVPFFKLKKRQLQKKNFTVTTIARVIVKVRFNISQPSRVALSSEDSYYVDFSSLLLDEERQASTKESVKKARVYSF